MLKFYAERLPYGKSIALHVGKECADGRFDAVKSLIFETVPDGLLGPPAPLTLTNDEGQALIDSLWSAGLRPSEGSGSAGAMLATQNHLADMRKLVAKQLDVTL